MNRVALLLAGGLLACGARQAAPDRAPKPTLDPARLEQCQSPFPQAPDQWQRFVGVGHGTTEAEALQAARADVQRQFVKHKPGHAKQEWSVLNAQLSSNHRKSRYWVEDGLACVEAIVGWDSTLRRYRSFAQQLDDGLDQIHEVVQQRLGEAALRVDAPTWGGSSGSSGVVAGPMGLQLQAALKNRFARTRSDAEYVLGGYINVHGPICRFNPILHRSGQSEGVPGFDFHPLALGQRDCRDVSASALGDARIGLDLSGRRPGIDGLLVDLRLDGIEGGICAGARFTARASVNRPANLRLYAVYENGEVSVVHPAIQVKPGAPFEVVMISVEMIDRAYRFIAVAVPLEADFGDYRPATPYFQGGCVGRTGLTTRDFPPIAAWSATQVHVHPLSDPRCQASDRARHQQLLDAYRYAPRCRGGHP